MKQIQGLCLDVYYRIRMCGSTVMPHNETQMQDRVYLGKANNHKIP